MRKGRRFPAVQAVVAFAVFAFLAGARPVLAVCGDVTGDEKVTTNDALQTLRTAVGQEVPMTCAPEAPPVENYVGYLNLLFCDGDEFTSTLWWSEHPELEWNSYTSGGDDDPDYQRVDDLFVQGYVEVSFGNCGDLVFDIDEWGVYYPMPYQGGALFTFSFDPYTETVVLWLSIAPIDLDAAPSAARAAAAPSPRMILAVAPAPPGLRGR